MDNSNDVGAMWCTTNGGHGTMQLGKSGVTELYIYIHIHLQCIQQGALAPC